MSESELPQMQYNAVAGHQAELRSHTGIQFKHILCRSGAWIDRALLHLAGPGIFSHTDQLQATAEIHDVEWNPGVFHPEAAWCIILENKQHAVAFGQAVAVHQAECLFVWGIGNLYAELLPLQFNIIVACGTCGETEQDDAQQGIVEIKGQGSHAAHDSKPGSGPRL